jgi:hypothetical protein
VEVSSSEDDVPKPNASTNKHKRSVGDDAKEGGVSSAELIAPNLISFGVLENPVLPPLFRLPPPFFPLAKVHRSVVCVLLGATSRWIG